MSDPLWFRPAGLARHLIGYSADDEPIPVNPPLDPDAAGPNPDDFPDHPDLPGRSSSVRIATPNRDASLRPRSPEAVLAFFAAQDGLGEYPSGSNSNWATQATAFVGQPWCLIFNSLALLAAGFNSAGRVLDFGTPDDPPAWANDLPDVDGLGYESTYRWGSAYTWAVRSNAIIADRWIDNAGAGLAGDTVIVNHNGRGGPRDGNSHGCSLIGYMGDGSLLTANGNISNRVRQAIWTPDVVEGFARPAFSTSPSPPVDPWSIDLFAATVGADN